MRSTTRWSALGDRSCDARWWAAASPPRLVSGPAPASADFIHRMMYSDTLTYLPDDILVKVDRASMAVEPRGARAAARPPRGRVRLAAAAVREGPHGQGKWLLRQLLDRHVPRELFDRPKQGFGVPLDEWLRGPLRDWAEDAAGAGAARREGFLEPAPVARLARAPDAAAATGARGCGTC